MDICMVCYDFDIDDKFFCCNMCLLDIYICSISNNELKLIEVIEKLHHKNIYKIDIKNS
jgi:hypothetical protein